MKISLRWPHDYVSDPVFADDVAKALTARGIEVEGKEEIGQGISGVVTAEIVSSRAHPNSQKLSLCTISFGSEAIEVVCGAKNWKVGDIVPFARVGATL